MTKLKSLHLGTIQFLGSILLYFHVTNNKVMAVLTILSMYQTNIHQFLTKQESEEARMKLLQKLEQNKISTSECLQAAKNEIYPASLQTGNAMSLQPLLPI